MFLGLFILLHYFSPPGLVLEAFKQKFPSAVQIKWSKENAHEYEAEFKMNTLSYSANFNDKGIWLETESPIGLDGLPDPIKKSVGPKDRINRLYKIEKADGTIHFEIEIQKGSRVLEKIYDQNGLEIRS
ncbi:MAG: PepSY-like domain-containing protein [Saprospiraceae bacterium]